MAMDQSVTVGFIDDKGKAESVNDICIAWMVRGDCNLTGITHLWIEFNGTLDFSHKGVKKDYFQCLSLAYNSFGMKRVFKEYIFPNYSKSSLKTVKRESWVDQKLLVTPNIPYLLFLMLVTIIRYAGEKKLELDVFNNIKSIIKKDRKLTYKQEGKLFLLCDTVDFEYNPPLKNYATGHSLSSIYALGENGENLKFINTLHKRVSAYIDTHKNSGINSGRYEKGNLYKLVLPVPLLSCSQFKLPFPINTNTLAKRFKEVL